MTLSLYKQNKIIDKWVNGGQVKTIAREEKVCAETVRRCLERNNDQTGYTRGCKPNKLKNLAKKGNNQKNCSASTNITNFTKSPPNIDHVCSLLEGMIQKENNLRTTMIESESMDMTHSGQSFLVKQLVTEIQDIHGQLAEFREMLNKMKDSLKK